MLRAGEQGSPSHLLAAAELGASTGFGTAKLGVNELGRVQLLLPVASGVRPPRLEAVRTLEITVRSLVGPDGARSYLMVTCLDAAHERAFADVVEAVLVRLRDGENAASAVISAVTELRALFEPPGRDVDERVVLGLVAELEFLRRLMERTSRATEVWFGADADRHDFRGGNVAVEVKASLREVAPVTISSVEQLAPPSGASLYLRRTTFDRTPDGDLSVAALHDEIVRLGAPVDLLRQQLGAAGCADPQDSAWTAFAYTRQRTDTYHVAKDFPRIAPDCFVGGTLPRGVLGLTYQVDLSAASHLRLDDASEAGVEAAIVKGLT
jgi:hypothetical protein